MEVISLKQRENSSNIFRLNVDLIVKRAEENRKLDFEAKKHKDFEGLDFKGAKGDNSIDVPDSLDREDEDNGYASD
jgi:hypothetical protein